MTAAITSIHQYVAEHATVTPISDIVARWENRIIPAGLQKRGRAGATSYLGQYGIGIRSPKVIQFARLADINGFPEMAAGFWEYAFFLETGERAIHGSVPSTPVAQVTAPTLKASFGQQPLLLTAIDRPTAMRLARQPYIGLQEKKDGERLLTKTGNGTVSGGNKKGLVAAVPLLATDELLCLGETEADGEKIGATYHVFDLLSHRGLDLRPCGFLVRYLQLAELVAAGGDSYCAVKLVPLITELEEKVRFIAELEQGGKEGFVLKDLRAPYKPGVGTAQFKFQFRQSASFIVGDPNPNGRRSVQLFALRPNGSQRDVGFVTVPASAQLPRPGDIVSVQYLYVHAGPIGKLHQAVFEGVRSPGDADASDCLEAKLKIVASEDDEEPVVCLVAQS